MKRTITALGTAAALLLSLAACSAPAGEASGSSGQAATERTLILSDQSVTLDGQAITGSGAVTVSNDIVYYQSGMGQDYGEGEAADHEEQAGSIDELDLETGASAGKLVAVVAEAALVIEEELLFDAGIAAGVRLAGTAFDDREAVRGAALECQGACCGGACHDLSPSFVCVEQPCYTHWLRRRNQAEQLFDSLYSTRTSVRFKRICEHLFEILEIMPYNRSQVTNRRLCHGV